MTVIRLQNVVHTYRDSGLSARTVLNIPLWQADAGEHILLRGQSGSGKTTLLNILAGLLTPTQGEVTIAGQVINTLSEAKRDRFRAQHIGYVFQTHNLLSFSALENVEMPLAFVGERPALRRQKAREALAQVGLSDWAANYPHQLSAGQRLRVAVARASVSTPEILLADEPTAALDPDLAAQIMDLIQLVCHQRNATLIVASHDPSIVTRFPRIIELRSTELIESQQEPLRERIQ